MCRVKTLSYKEPSEKVKVAQSCPTLCDPMDYTVHGILQARILEWVAFPFSRGSSQHRDQNQVSALQADSSPAEPGGKPKETGVSSLSLLQRIFLTQELNWGYQGSPTRSQRYYPIKGLNGLPDSYVLSWRDGIHLSQRCPWGGERHIRHPQPDPRPLVARLPTSASPPVLSTALLAAILVSVVILSLKTASPFLFMAGYTPKPLFFWMPLWDLFNKQHFSKPAFMQHIENHCHPS